MRHWSDRYLLCPYRPGGRGPDAYDCWGLVREVLPRLGWPPLPAFGRIHARDPARVAAAAAELAAGVVACPPREGALAAVYRHGALIHVGAVLAVDGRLWVLHTGSDRGPRRERLAAFARSQPEVRYYRVAD